MPAALLASLFLLLSRPVQTDDKNVDLAQIGLSFSCPKSWEITADKKDNVSIVFPIPDTQDTASLNIYPVDFDQDSDTWQRMQDVFSKTLKREVVKQWTETILSVPLLLTRVNYIDNKTPMANVTGLLYSSNPRKLMYRLACTPEDFDKADYAWRTVLQSLRTFNGRPLTAQVPGKTTDPKETVDIPTKPPTHILLGGGNSGERPIKKADKTLDLTVANRKVQVRYPGTWTASVDPSGAITLKSAGVAQPVTVGAFSVLDSDPPQRALFRASSSTLDQYAKVAQRDESPLTKNLAGASLWTIWRSGTASSGSLFSCDACVSLNDFYLLVGYKSTDATKSVAERKLIDTLLDEISVEAVGS